MKNNFSRNFTRFFPYLIFILAFGLRLTYVYSLDNKAYYFDTTHYDTAAKSLVAGQGFGPSLHYYQTYKYYCLEPTYPLFLATIYSMFGQDYFAVRLAQVILSMLHMVLIFFIAQKLLPIRLHLWVLGITAVYPFFIYISGLLYVTQLFSLLLTLACALFLIYFEKRRVLWVALAALTLGFAMQTRPVLIPGLLLFVLWIYFLPGLKKRKKIAHILMIVGIVSVVFAPWTLRNYRVFGTFSPGRACLAENRVIESLHSIYTTNRLLKEDPPFNYRTFSVKIVNSDSLLFHCYLDDEHFVTLKPLEPLPYRTDGHFGLIFYGGDSLKIEQLQAWAKPEDRLVFSSQQIESIVYHTSDDISISQKNIALDSCRESWDNKIVFANNERVSRLLMTFHTPQKTSQIRRSALLLGLDSFSLQANGYMLWLQPNIEADLWIVQNGKPFRSIEVKKMEVKKNSTSIFDLISRYPVEYVTQHYLPEFINFWSPRINRITTLENQPTKFLDWISLLFFTPILFSTPFGCWALRSNRYRMLLLLIPLLTLSMGYALFFTEIRYRIPVDGFMLVFSAAGVDFLYKKLRGEKNV